MRLLASAHNKPVLSNSAVLASAAHLAKAEVVPGKMKHSDVATFRRCADQLMSSFDGIRRGGRRKQTADRRRQLECSTVGPFVVAIAPRILRRNPRLDMRVMHDHAHTGDISRRENVPPTFHPHVIADVERAFLIARRGLMRRARAHPAPDAGRSREEFFPRRSKAIFQRLPFQSRTRRSALAKCARRADPSKHEHLPADKSTRVALPNRLGNRRASDRE